MIKLGDKVRDTISGLEGIVTQRTEFLNGCIQYALQPKIKKGTDMPPAWHIDEEQLEVIEKKKPAKKKKKSAPGGPTRKALTTRR